MLIQDYDILNILSKNVNSKSYKVIHKNTNQLYVWTALAYEKLNKPQREIFQEKIASRVCLQHPNILEFYDPIKEEPGKYYIVTRYCKNGSLKDLIGSCLKNNQHITEEFLCKIMYQLAFTIKTINSYVGTLSPNEIFFDDDFNVKLYNFQLVPDENATDHKISSLGALFFHSCTLKENLIDYEKKLKHMSKLYSKAFSSLIVNMMRDNGELKGNIDEILCHPTVLLNSARWDKTKCITYERDEIHTSQLEKLRTKEIYLQKREQKLNEWENRLAHREKKIALMESMVKERLQQAELHLKRCRDKSSSTISSNKSLHIGSTNKENHDVNLDSTYVSIGDSVILPTSKKLNVNDIIKPAPFTRTLSERRIRFKGHSPLKDIDFNKRKSVRLSKKVKEKNVNKTEWTTCSEDNDKTSIENERKIASKKCKQLFPKSNMYENFDLKVDEEQCKPIKWTEENKKNAFRLLKMMNGNKENKCEVKHTYL